MPTSNQLKLSCLSLITLTLSLNCFAPTIAQTQTDPSLPTPTPETNSPSSTTPARKLRVAVLDFDFSSVSNPSLFYSFPGESKGVSDILVNRLVATGNFTVIERSQIEAVLAEQNFGASGRIEPSSAAEIGRILGVDAIIIGTITQFDVQQRESGGGIIGIGVGVSKKEAYVKLNVRLIDTSTAEILATAEGNGTANQSDTEVSVIGIGGGSETENTGKLLTFATEQAIDQVIADISSQSNAIAIAPGSQATAVIAYVSGNTVVLNQGTTSGYSVGMKLSIERLVEEVKDPQTGAIIHQVTNKVAEVEIVEVDNDSSVAKILTGSPLNVGDIAKPMQ